MTRPTAAYRTPPAYAKELGVDPIYVARKSTLKEVSFLSIGADDRAAVKIAATANLNKKASTNMNDRIALKRLKGGFQDQIIAGLTINAGLELQLPGGQQYRDNLLNLAEDEYGGRGLTIRAACQEILEIEGEVVPLNNPDIIQAAFSGGSGVAVFSGLVNTALM